MSGVIDYGELALYFAKICDPATVERLLQRRVQRTTNTGTRLDRNCEQFAQDGQVTLQLGCIALLATVLADLMLLRQETISSQPSSTAGFSATLRANLALDQPPTAPLREDGKIVLQLIDTLQVLCEQDNPAMSQLFLQYVDFAEPGLTYAPTITTRRNADQTGSLGLIGLLNSILALLCAVYQQPAEFLSPVYEHGKLQGFQRAAGWARWE